MLGTALLSTQAAEPTGTAGPVLAIGQATVELLNVSLPSAGGHRPIWNCKPWGGAAEELIGTKPPCTSAAGPYEGL